MIIYKKISSENKWNSQAIAVFTNSQVVAHICNQMKQQLSISITGGQARLTNLITTLGPTISYPILGTS